MTDDKRKAAPQERKQVNCGEEYEIEHLVTKFGVTPEAIGLAEATVGKSRAKIEEYLKNRQTM